MTTGDWRVTGGSGGLGGSGRLGGSGWAGAGSGLDGLFTGGGCDVGIGRAYKNETIMLGVNYDDINPRKSYEI